MSPSLQVFSGFPRSKEGWKGERASESVGKRWYWSRAGISNRSSLGYLAESSWAGTRIQEELGYTANPTTTRELSPSYPSFRGPTIVLNFHLRGSTRAGEGKEYFYCGHGPDATARDSDEQIVPGNFVPAISALGGFQRYLGILSREGDTWGFALRYGKCVFGFGLFARGETGCLDKEFVFRYDGYVESSSYMANVRLAYLARKCGMVSV